MRPLLIGVLALTVVAGACGEGDPDPGIVQPDVNPATVTETFTGTLAVQSASSHSFIISRPGKIAITLTAVNPPPTSEAPSSPEVGVGIGIPSGLACPLNLGNGTTVTATPAETPQISGTVLPGTFCVAVYDVGKLTESVDYTVAVAHP